MLFVIFSETQIPGYGGLRGPVLTPQPYDLKQVLNWIASGLDIREVMQDGSYRKCEFNDIRINKAIHEGYKYVNKTTPVVVEKSLDNTGDKKNRKKHKEQSIVNKSDVAPIDNIEQPDISLDYDKRFLTESNKKEETKNNEIVVDEIEEK